MFRNILHSRRVNKARRRLMALMPPEWVTVPTFALRTQERNLVTCVNEALDVWNEDSLIQLFVHTTEHETTKELLLDKGACNRSHSSTYVALDSPTTLSWRKNCFVMRDPPDKISLSQILHILVKTLDPDSIFALDSVLRSSILSTSRFCSSNASRSDCVFLKNVCVCSNRTHMLLVPHENLRRSLVLVDQANRTVRFGCTCQSVSTAKSTSVSVESKPIEHIFTDVDPGESRSFLLFDPLLAVCKAWRWPDLVSGEWVRHLNLCETTRNGIMDQLCINPHHWSRVIRTDQTQTSTANEVDKAGYKETRLADVTQPSGTDLRFENDPDLMCVGLAKSKTVQSCHCGLIAMETPEGSDRPLMTDTNSAQKSTQPNQTESFARSADVAGSHDASKYSSVSDMVLHLSPNYQQPSFHVSGSAVWHSMYLASYGTQSHRNNELVMSPCSTKTGSLVTPTVPATTTSCNTSSGEVDCITDSTILSDTSLSQFGANENDSVIATSGRTSSTSTSGTEEFVARSRPKKPRSLIPSKSECRPQAFVSTMTVVKPWANLSFWEETRHVGQSWFSLTGPVVRVVYDIGEKDDRDLSGVLDSCEKSTMNQQPFRRRHRGAFVRRTVGSSTHFIRLSRLVNRNRCASSSSKLNTSWVQPSHLSQCTACVNYAQPNGDKLSSATQGRRFSASSLTSCSQLSSPAKRSSSWRQCYRLGNQGIVFHVTTTGRVWIDNQTLAANLPLFVSSSFFIRNTTSALSDWPVYRVPAGCSILVFDRLAYQNAQSGDSVAFGKDPTAPDRALPLRTCTQHTPVVHISLGKGWGPAYRRPDLTHCPARLELWINVEHLCTVTACHARSA